MNDAEAKETLHLMSSPSIGCALAIPIIKVPAKRSTKPITAQPNQSQQQIAFGCSIAVPTCKE